MSPEELHQYLLEAIRDLVDCCSGELPPPEIREGFAKLGLLDSEGCVIEIEVVDEWSAMERREQADVIDSVAQEIPPASPTILNGNGHH